MNINAITLEEAKLINNSTFFAHIDPNTGSVGCWGVPVHDDAYYQGLDETSRCSGEAMQD